MAYILKYDDVDYTSYLSEEDDFTLVSNVEDGLNNPVCSTLEFTLNNRNNLHNNFGNTVDPFGIYNLGHIQLYDANDLPSRLIFDGYIDRESIDVNFSGQKIKIKAIGKEKQISDSASKFDLTQVFNERDSDINVRKRWGRSTTRRNDPNNYSYIESLVRDIFEDLGYDSTKQVIYIPYSSNYYFTYNAERYGTIDVERPIAVIRNNTGARNVLPQLSSGDFKTFYENDAESGSYNLLLKEFAKITNCIYFYHHTLGKVFFIPRDYEDLADQLGQAVIEIDNAILEDDYGASVEQPYNGVALKFNDIDLVVYKDNSGIIIGGSTKYGINVPEGVNPIITNETPNGYFIGFSGTTRRYKLGSSLTQFNYSLYLDNAIEVNMRADLWEYLRPDAGITGQADEIEDFLVNVIFENFYYYTMRSVKKRIVTINSVTPAPVRINYNDNLINCFYSETDLWNEVTTLEFKY